MTTQNRIELRDAIVGAYETTIGASPVLEIRTGAQPASCTAADTGTLLVSITLPADWLTAPSGGAVSKNGVWSATATAAGTAAHYRLKQSGLCWEQGNITATGGGGDITITSVAIAVNDTATVTSFTKTALNP
jgi:hypothetical protein